MREQLKFFCHRRLGELISSAQEDSQQEAMKLFVFKLLIHEVDKLSADGGGQEEIGRPVEQESILLGAFELLRGEVVEALTRGGTGSGGIWERESAAAQSIGLGFRAADRDDKVLTALQGIQATVDDLSQRFSHFEQVREDGKKAGVPPLHHAKDEPPMRIDKPPLHVPPLRNDESVPAFQTSIHILSQRVSKKLQAHPWKKRPAKGGQVSGSRQTGMREQEMTRRGRKLVENQVEEISRQGRPKSKLVHCTQACTRNRGMARFVRNLICGHLRTTCPFPWQSQSRWEISLGCLVNGFTQ
jgi:hypothetical protein